jgi:hypothetical protein
MATTIITKYGSGAPTASDVVRGELAVDTENGRLYTEDSGGSVIEIGVNPAADVTFGDNAKAVFGAGSDLQIYHDGSNSYIKDAGTGNLNVQGNHLSLEDSTGNRFFLGLQGGETRLYNQGNQKVAVTSTGIDVTGTVTADGVNIDGTGSTSSEQLLTLVNVGGAAGAGSRIWISGTNSTTRGVYIEGQAQSTGNDHDLIFATSAVSAAPVERLRIDSSGNVGIGTSSPNVHGWTKALSIDGGTSNSSAVELNQNGTKVGALSLQGDQRVQIVNHTANPLTFHTNGIANERMRIDSSGNVGIGSDSPSSYNSGGNRLVVGSGSGFQGITIASGSTQSGNLYFADGTTGDATYRGHITYDHSDDHMHFKTAGTERLRIDSSGNVGIGVVPESGWASNQTALQVGNVAADWQWGSGAGASRHFTRNIYHDGTNYKYLVSSEEAEMYLQAAGNHQWFSNPNGTADATFTPSEKMRLDSSGNLLVGTVETDIGYTDSGAGFSVSPVGAVQIARSDFNELLYLNKLDNDGPIVRLGKDGAAVGSIGTAVGNAYFAGTSTGITFGSANLYPTNSSGTKTDAALDLGSSSNRFKDLYLSGGVDISQGSAPQNAFLDFAKTINDDAVYSFTPDQDIGVLYIYGRNANYANVFGMVSYRRAATAYCLEVLDPNSLISTSTSVLTGTSGTDGQVTISAVSSDGKIYIENREGGAISIGIHISGQ